jgi:hypothetical protein
LRASRRLDVARDIPFVRITARLFTPKFSLRSSTTLPASIDDHNQPERDLILVRVRRTR